MIKWRDVNENDLRFIMFNGKKLQTIIFIIYISIFGASISSCSSGVYEYEFKIGLGLSKQI